MEFPSQSDQTPAESARFERRPVTTVDDRIWQGAFKGQSRSSWGGMGLGALTGVVLGAGLAFLPVLFLPATLVVAPTLGLVLGCMGAAGAIGMWMGSDVGSKVGAAAGASASATKEILRQQDDNFRKVMNEIRAGRGEPPLPDEKPDVDIKQPEAPDAPHGFKKYVNWKTGLAFVAIGASFGALAAFAPGALGIGVLLAKAGLIAEAGTLATAGAAQLVGMCAAAGGILGSIFGINYPVICNKFTNAFGAVLSGRPFEFKRPTVTSAAKEISQAPTLEAKIDSIAKNASRMPAYFENEKVTGEDMAKLNNLQNNRAEKPQLELLADRQNASVQQSFQR